MITVLRSPIMTTEHCYRTNPTRQPLSVRAAHPRDGICDTDEAGMLHGTGKSVCFLRRRPTANTNPVATVTPPTALPPDKSP